MTAKKSDQIFVKDGWFHKNCSKDFCQDKFQLYNSQKLNKNYAENNTSNFKKCQDPIAGQSNFVN